jgi:hypothetical protein
MQILISKQKLALLVGCLAIWYGLQTDEGQGRLERAAGAQIQWTAPYQCDGSAKPIPFFHTTPYFNDATLLWLTQNNLKAKFYVAPGDIMTNVRFFVKARDLGHSVGYLLPHPTSLFTFKTVDSNGLDIDAANCQPGNCYYDFADPIAAQEKIMQLAKQFMQIQSFPPDSITFQDVTVEEVMSVKRSWNLYEKVARSLPAPYQVLDYTLSTLTTGGAGLLERRPGGWINFEMSWLSNDPAATCINNAFDNSKQVLAADAQDLNVRTEVLKLGQAFCKCLGKGSPAPAPAANGGGSNNPAPAPAPKTSQTGNLGKSAGSKISPSIWASALLTLLFI